MNLRSKMLALAHKILSFSLKGDASIKNQDNKIDLSCLINIYGRIDLLEGILYSLAGQNLSKDRFEVILVEDRGGTERGQNVADKFRGLLNIKYYALSEHYGMMGYSRNHGLSKARGRFVLFLDDDTVILQNDFLLFLIKEFDDTGAGAVVPHGSSSYCLLKGKSGFHDPYFPTNRCMAYSMDVLEELGGFVSEIVDQEDVEFVIRFKASGKNFYTSEKLYYLHPPLLVGNIQKPAAVGLSFAKLRKRYPQPAAVGLSFAKLRKRYPLIIWLLLLLNGARYLPLLLVPFNMKWRMQGKFSLGFLVGIIYSAIGKRAGYNET